MDKNKKQNMFKLLLISALTFLLIFQFPFNSTAENIFESEEVNHDENDAKNDAARSYLIDQLFAFDLDITYAIIAPGEFIVQLEPFRDWKTKKGIPAHIFDLGDILERYSGMDNATRIHKFLVDLVARKPDTQWLLLVGDSEIIPSPEVRTDILGDDVWEDYQDFTYSDYFYAGLESTWDHDSDGIYGEVMEDYDWSAELYVGRLPVSTTGELATVMNKLYVYERSPPSGTWYNNAILVGAVMETFRGPNVPDNESTSWDDGYNDYKDNALKVNQKVKNLLPENYNPIEFYDYHELLPGNYKISNDTLYRTNVVSNYNTGSSLVNLVSHGYENGDGHVEYAGDGINVAFSTFYDYTDAQNAENGYMLPLVYSSSCTSGNFTEIDDTGLERLLTAEKGGAIGLVGATVITYRGEFKDNGGSFGNWWLDETFFKMFFMGDHKPGRVLYLLKEEYAIHVNEAGNPQKDDENFQQIFRVNQLAYNYLGDPEMSIWTKPPSHLDVQFEKIYKPSYWTESFRIIVTDRASGGAVKNARVAIQGQGQVDWVLTDKTGVAEIVLTNNPGMSYDLTVTADDYLPFEDRIEVHTELNLKSNADNLTADRTQLARGAAVNFTMQFKNTGSITAPEVEVVFYDGPPENNKKISAVYSFNDVTPGSFEQFRFQWTMPGGVHDIYAVVDPDNKLMEFNETDNTAWIKIVENSPPLFYELPVIPLSEDEPYENALRLTNYVWERDESDTLTFTIIDKSDPSCKVSIDEQLNIDISSDPNWSGTCNVTIEVSDGINTVISYLEIIVNPVNDPPVLKPIANQTLLEDQLFELVLFGYDHIESDDRVFYETDLYDAISGLEPNITSEFDYETGVLKMTPDNSMVGKHTVSFRAVDEWGARSAWESVEFDVINTPDPPIITLEDNYYAMVGATFELRVQVDDEDIGDTLMFWDDTDLFDIDPATGIISFSPERGDEGSHTITVSVFDGNITMDRSFDLEIEGGGWSSVQLYAAIGIIALIVGISAGAVMIMIYRRKLGGTSEEKVKEKEERTDHTENDDADEDEEEETEEEEGELKKHPAKKPPAKLKSSSSKNEKKK